MTIKITPLKEQMKDDWTVNTKGWGGVTITHPATSRPISLQLMEPCDPEDYQVKYLFDLSEDEMDATGGKDVWDGLWGEDDRYEWAANPLVQVVEVEDVDKEE